MAFCPSIREIVVMPSRVHRTEDYLLHEGVLVCLV